MKNRAKIQVINMKKNIGYGSAKETIDLFASVLEDISILIGEPVNEKIKLKNNGMIVPGLGLNYASSEIAKRSKDIKQGIFNVLVIGEFKNGKSTLINALIGEETVIRKATPATAVITKIVYGTSEEVAIYEFGKKEPLILGWNEFRSKYQLTKDDIRLIEKQGTIDRFKNIDYAQIERTHRFLANGVKLIDSPGLGEQISRTNITTNFVNQAHAIVFVLNATAFISETERKFIETNIGSGRLSHVFFVINRIDFIHKEDFPELKELVQEVFKHHFYDKNDRFDENLYNRRVFFVNSESALEARCSKPINEAKLKSSGILELEHELEIFLTSDEKTRAILQTTVDSVIHVISRSQKHINQIWSTLDTPLDEIEKNNKEIELRLNELNQKKFKIEQNILGFADPIGEKIYDSLKDYTSIMSQTWEDESKNIINLEEISFGLICKAIISNESRQKIEAITQAEFEKYLKFKFETWSKQIQPEILKYLKNMELELKDQIEVFELSLSQIKSIFFSGCLMSDVELDTEKGHISKMVQTTIGVMMLDPSQVTGTLVGKGDWSGFISRIISDFIVVSIVFSILGPLSALIAYIIAELLHMGFQAEDFRIKIKKSIGERIFKKDLPNAINNMRSDILLKTRLEFKRIAQNVIDPLQKQIDEYIKNQEAILTEKRDKTFSVSLEKKRLEAIEVMLLELANTVSISYYGKCISREEIEKFASDKSISSNEGKKLVSRLSLMEPKKQEYFDVFISYNRDDSEQVIEIYKELNKQNIKTWLDLEELRPGQPWQKEVDLQIKKSKSFVICIGRNGIGRWENLELYSVIKELVTRGCPVIPVILPNASEKKELSIPGFLENLTWVDFHNNWQQAYNKLIWGITGKKPL